MITNGKWLSLPKSGGLKMSDNAIALLVFGIYAIIACLVIIVWIFVKPEDDLEYICVYGLLWAFALILIVVFIPFKLLEILQNKLLERRSKKKYYDEDEYRSENEDWYSEE